MKGLFDRTALLAIAASAGLAIAASAGLALAVPALAQPTAPTAGAPMAGAPAAGAPSGKTGAAAAGAPTAAPGPSNWVQEQIDRLHRQLKITPAQEPTWTQFADTMRANSQHMEQMYQDRSERFQNMNAVENLKNYQEISQVQAEDLGKKVAAFQTLYDSLSPEQKQAADRVFRYQEEHREQRHMAHRG